MSIGDTAAKLGLPVFPCGDNKRPVIEAGFKSASKDPRTIVEAFNRPGATMIGMPTGQASGLIAIDIDVRADRSGMDWLNENAEALPETRTHKTRSGGLHLLFRVPEGVEIRNSASRVAPGVDVRGEGGYVILPPSPGYQLADSTLPAEMPLWLIRACLKPEPAPQTDHRPAQPVNIDANGGTRYGLAALRGECSAITSAGDGQKHYALNKAAYAIGGLVAVDHLRRDVAASALRDALEGIRGRCEDFAAAERTLKEAFEAGINKPRHSDGARPTASAERPPPPPWEASERPSPPVEPPARPAASNQLPLLYFHDIEPILDARDFVQGILLEEGSVVIYGESNAGKTFWATDLALHVATGDRWCGRRVEQGGVVYCVLEGGIGFRNRVAAWRAAHDCDRQPIPFAAIPSGLDLLDPEADTPRLIEAIKRAAEEMGFEVKLVVIDTLSRAMAGGNENAPDDMGALVMNMDRIRAETKACVMFIHHSGKDAAKGARGHSSLRAAIDTEIEVVATDGPEKTATVVKQREMKKGDVFGFTLRVVELGTNRHTEQVTTCVVDYGDADQAASAASEYRSRRLQGHAKRALEVLSNLVASSGRTGDRGTPSGCPSVPEKWWRDRFYDSAMPGAEQDTKTRTFNRIGSQLLELRYIGMGGGRVWLARNENKTCSEPDKYPDIGVVRRETDTE